MKTVLIALVLFAWQGGPEKPGSQARQEVKAYFEQNIAPVLQEQRQLLEEELSAEDKKTISDLREQMKALHEEGRAFREQLRLNRSDEDFRPSKADRQEHREAHKQRLDILVKTNEIVSKYEDQIDESLESIEVNRDSWSKEIKQILDAHKLNGNNTDDDAHRKRRVRKPLGFERLGVGGPFPEAIFLLMDPNNPMGSSDETEDKVIFPVPTGDFLNIDLTDTPGEVILLVYDNSGELMMTLIREVDAKGIESIDVSNLESGIYFLKIQTADVEETHRFLKE